MYKRQPFSYVVTVKNLGPSAAGQVQLTDTLPSEFVLAGSSASQGVCVAGTDALGNFNGTVRCNLDEIARGAQATVTITGSTTSTAQLFNEACAEGIGLNDPAGPVCNTTVIQVGPADLEALLAVSPDPSTAGDLVTLTATAKNWGPSTAKASAIKLRLPSFLDFVSTTAASGCTFAPEPGTGVNQATCPVGDIASGAQVSIDIVVRFSSSGNLPLTLSVATQSSDTASYNDETTYYATVQPASSPICPLGKSLTTLVADTTETGGAGWGPSTDDTCTGSCATLAWALDATEAHAGVSSWHIVAP